MHIENTSYLRIEHYSGHPEVASAADVLVKHVAKGKKFLKNKRGWTSAARKLVASLWMRNDDLFRFGTKKDYFSAVLIKLEQMHLFIMKLYQIQPIHSLMQYTSPHLIRMIKLYYSYAGKYQ